MTTMNKSGEKSSQQQQQQQHRSAFYSHKAASNTQIARLERSIEYMALMPEEIAKAHLLVMGFKKEDSQHQNSAAFVRGRLLKLLSDEVLREAKKNERLEVVQNNEKNKSNKAYSESSSENNRRRGGDEEGDDDSTETKIVKGGVNNKEIRNNRDDSDSDSSVQGKERPTAAATARATSLPRPPVVSDSESDSESELESEGEEEGEEEEEEEEEEDNRDNYFGKAALEPDAPPGSNPFATITSARQKEMENEALKQIEEAKQMMADMKLKDSKQNNNGNDDDDDEDNDVEEEEEGRTVRIAQLHNSKLKNVSFPVDDDVRSIVSSKGGDDVGSVKDFGGSEYGGSIYSVAATHGSNQNEQDEDGELLDQLVEEANLASANRRIDEEDEDDSSDNNRDSDEGKENEEPIP